MKTYYIVTIGCQMNKSDSERIAGYLEKQGLKLADKRSQADVVVLTTCGVRQSAEDRIYGLVPRIKKENFDSMLIFTGCLSERDDIKKKLKNHVDIWLPIGELPYLNLRISNPESRKKEIIENCNYLESKANHTSKISAFVPIGNGCNNYCSYCVVPYARGREKYRRVEDIINEVEELVNNGYKEINLIAQNVNSYSDNKKYCFSDLIRDTNKIQGNFWIRFSTSHPKDMSDELIKAVADCDKVCEHIHLPIQAGNDEILKKMNRKYTVADYKKLLKKIRNTIPNVSVSSDIIVGFPGETKEQFRNSAELVKEAKFYQIFISQYSPRPQTDAAKLKDDVPKEEKKKRKEELTEILRHTALENNQDYIGKEVEVLVEGRNKKENWHGKTRTGKNVEITNSKKQIKDLLGKFVKVKIIEAKEFGLKGNLL